MRRFRKSTKHDYTKGNSTMTDTDNDTMMDEVPAPGWYPGSPEWQPEGSWFFVAPELRGEYARECPVMPPAYSSGWHQPSKSLTAGPLLEGLPPGWSLERVAPTKPGREPAAYLLKDGSWASAQADCHLYALEIAERRVRQAESMSTTAALHSRACVVCDRSDHSTQMTRLRVGREQVWTCPGHAAVLVAAVADVAATEVLPDGRTVRDAALAWACAHPGATILEVPAGDHAPVVGPSMVPESSVEFRPVGQGQRLTDGIVPRTA